MPRKAHTAEADVDIDPDAANLRWRLRVALQPVPATEPSLIGGVVEGAFAEAFGGERRANRISAVRSIGSAATCASMLDSVPRTTRSFGQLALTTMATGQSAP